MQTCITFTEACCIYSTLYIYISTLARCGKLRHTAHIRQHSQRVCLMSESLKEVLKATVEVPRIMTKSEVTEYFHISKSQLERWVKTGKFPAPFKISEGQTGSAYWFAEDLIKYIASQK